MNLLQKRGFSEIFADTFGFIKLHWKHYLTTYFIINGLFLLLSMIKNYYLGKGIQYPAFGVLTVVIIVLSLVNYSFVTFYLMLYRDQGTDFNYQDIIEKFKKNFGKIIVFAIVGFIVAIPVFIVMGILMALLSFTVVGIALFPLIISGLALWYGMAFYEHIYGLRRDFGAFGYAWKLLKKNIWATTGSLALLYMVVLIVNFGGLAGSGIFSDLMNMNFTDPSTFVNLSQAVFSPIALILGAIGTVLASLVQICQGIIYFSQKELLENISTKDAIDQIGDLGKSDESSFV